MIYGLLSEYRVCIGYSNLSAEVDSPSLIYLHDGWDEDILWRKYENGEWSAGKFEPIPPIPGPSVESQIQDLKNENLTLMEAITELYEMVLIGGTA